MTNKAVFKFNGGNPVILCSKCSVIIKYSKDFTEEESKACNGEAHLSKQYCEKCKKQ